MRYDLIPSSRTSMFPVNQNHAVQSKSPMAMVTNHNVLPYAILYVCWLSMVTVVLIQYWSMAALVVQHLDRSSWASCRAFSLASFLGKSGCRHCSDPLGRFRQQGFSGAKKVATTGPKGGCMFDLLQRFVLRVGDGSQGYLGCHPSRMALIKQTSASPMFKLTSCLSWSDVVR